MKLYGYHRSSAAFRVRIALHLKNIDCELAAVNLLAHEQQDAAYLALNPAGLVPLLVLDDGSRIAQSPAILAYLDERFPEPGLLPEDLVGRAQVRALASAIACDIHPLNNLRVQRELVDRFQASSAQKLDWYHHWLEVGFAALEPLLGDGPYAAGQSVTLADLYLVPQVYNALRFEHDMAAYPRIRRCYAACADLPAFQQAAPERQVDA